MIYHGDCLEVLRSLPDCSVDAVVTDPPYGLSFMGRKWDYDVPAQAIWEECLRVLKPGGHLLAFAGTRTQHRMAVRIEDAGFEIRDMIAWVYGSGFPKSLDVSKAIDRAAGAEREVVGSKLGQPGYSLADNGRMNAVYGDLHDPAAECAITAPATPEAQQWSGWGTALKPALEPITVARKPLIGTVAENVLEHGTGAINVDGCRVAGTEDTARAQGKDIRGGNWSGDGERSSLTTGGGTGRWPANLIHDGSEEVTSCFPTTTSGGGDKHGKKPSTFCASTNWEAFKGTSNGGDTGSAARFFYCAKASKDDRDEGLNGFEAKVTVSNMCSGSVQQSGEGTRLDGNPLPKRANFHPTVKPTGLMRYLCRLVTPPGGTVLDPFMGSGSTGKAAILEGFSFIGIERESEYVEIAKARIAAAQTQPKQESLF